MSGKIFLAFLIFATIFHQSNGCWSFGGTSTTTTATSSTTAKPSTEPSTTSSVITTSTTISSSTTTITTTSTTPTTTSKYLTIPNYQLIIMIARWPEFKITNVNWCSSWGVNWFLCSLWDYLLSYRFEIQNIHYEFGTNKQVAWWPGGLMAM